MHIVVERGYEKTVKSLVEKGADPNIQDKDGVRSLYSLPVTYIVLLV